METRESTAGKIALFRYDTPGKPEAVILMVHGLGEHSGRYNKWFERFTSEGVAVRAFDLPGHGHSGGRRGVMPPFEILYSLTDQLLDEIKGEYPAVPVFIYGHSLGGGIALHYILKHKPAITGAIITSPWIKLAEEPPRVKLILARLSSSIFPSLAQSSGLKTEYLSHDDEVVQAYRNDPMVHGLISAGLYVSMTVAAGELLEHASEISLPLLLVHGRDDMITSPGGTMEVAGKAPHATLKLWDGAFHEVHNDTLRNEHYLFIREWMESMM